LRPEGVLSTNWHYVAPTIHIAIVSGVSDICRCHGHDTYTCSYILSLLFSYFYVVTKKASKCEEGLTQDQVRWEIFSEQMGHHGKSCKNSSQYDAIHHLSKEQVIYESLLNKLESLDPHPLLPNNLASQFLSLYSINNHNHQIKHSSNTTNQLWNLWWS
jgi:hypothetical protein